MMNKYFSQSVKDLHGLAVLPQHESLYSALKMQYGDSFEPVVSKDGKTIVLADPDFQESGRILVCQETKSGNFEVLQSIEGNFFENEKGFGTSVDMSEDGSVISVMSEFATVIRHKKIQTISGMVRIYTRTPIGQYLCRSSVFPRFIEESSRYGDSLMLSADGKVLFISAPSKENDATTGANGSTGAVYTFMYDEKLQTYIQHQLIRPPREGISHFGRMIGSENDTNFYATDSNNSYYTFEFKKLTESALGFESGWVFKEESSF